ncbi:dienelactone hydrolase family protein [Massilia sp. SM-13]|uniref:dienelactone hydrolase family protein n=1 Tax=Pseudoduganella rhizocola TaxID=3382643 RepID=UPI0038B57034
MRILFAAVILSFAGLSQAAPNFTFDPAPGPHGVGVRVVEQYDYTRNYRGRYDVVTGKPVTGETARPVQTVVWYPAQKSGKRVSYGDYFNLNITADQFGMPAAEIRKAAEVRLQDVAGQTSAAVASAELAAPMLAVRDAKPVAGKFPVVIYAPSFSAGAAENAELCEYLASHGYVVIASPSMGAATRSMTDNLEGIEAQAADIAFLIGYAHTLPQADLGKLAVAGFSWGGISNVFVAARDSRVKALVNLDGSVRYWPEMIEQAKYVQPARVAIPMLFLAQRPRSLEDLARRGKPVTSFLNEMKYSDLYTVTLHPMEHHAFASDSLHMLSDKRFEEYSRAEAGQAYGWMARYVLNFLNAYLLGQEQGKAFLNNTPKQNGVPPHMASMVKTMSQGAAPTLEMLAAEAGKTNFANVQEVFTAMRKREPKFTISEPVLNDWGYKLLRGGNGKAAVEILKLATVLYPDSGNAFDSLAEAHEANQDKVQAVENYQRSLQLDPGNSNAEKHLKALGAAPR